MSIPSLSGSYIDQTYQRLVQTNDTRTEFADGLGRAISFGGSTTPGGPINSIQINQDGINFIGSSALTFQNNYLTLTGSFLVSGSTTQIGNNTLLGNTLLSGSVIISGSTTVPASPTIKVYGDMETNGVIKFLAVDKNIDTSISGSYIYVSGSTNDLYFSQNGAGFNNNVRLRWLEGGALYTGLLRGGVISSTPGTTTFNITSGSGLLVTMNASTASEPYPTVQYLSWPDFTAQPIIYSGSAKITYVGISSAGTVIQQTVPWGTNDINQWDNSLNLGVVLHLSGSVSTGVFNSPQISYGGQQKTDDFFRAFGPLKISGHTLRASGSSPTLSIIKDAGTSYREGANYVINANHPSTVVENSINVSKIYRYYISGSTPVIDTGVANAGYTTIDSKYYVDTTTGQLTLVGGAYWSIQRVFWVPNSPTNAFIVYYGNDRYRSLVDATNARDSEPFIEAPNTAQNAIFVGYIIIQGGGSGTPPRDLLNASEATIIPAGLFRNVGGIGSSGTNFVSTTLAGLADVSITSPTNGQPLVYNSTTTKWINSSALTASLFGTASWANNVTTSSLALRNIVTASVSSNTITFTKGDGTQFPITVNTGSGGGGSTTPGGSSGQIQYNNSNTFNGVPTLTYDGTTLTGTGSFSGSFTGLYIQPIKTAQLYFGDSLGGEVTPPTNYSMSGAGIYEITGGDPSTVPEGNTPIPPSLYFTEVIKGATITIVAKSFDININNKGTISIVDASGASITTLLANKIYNFYGIGNIWYGGYLT